jgi:hypothetical protein
MSTLAWARHRVSGNATASPFRTDVNMATVPIGSTVRRSIVTFDWWVDSNTTEFIDVQATVNYGISYWSSSITPTITPWTDYASTSPRWLYWDQLELRPIEIYDVAGTIYYLSKNGNGSRYIDTRTQWKNDGGSTEYLWFSVEPDPAAVTNWSDTYWTVSSSILIETP